MAKVEVTGDTVVVSIEGADALFALRSQLKVPLTHVTGPEGAEAQASEWFKGIRLGGTHVPGLLSAGSFYQHGQHTFWDVHHPDRAVAIHLRDERYAALVVEVDDPAATIAEVNAAITRTR